jgi:hypothetical protein
MTGSFNPIDVGEWSENAYIGDTTKFFKAIVSFDRDTVLKMIKEGTADVNRRDHVGRTPLLLAVMVKAVDIAVDLIDNDARMTARMVDGRTALHIAARLDLPVVIRKLIERSVINEEKAKEDEEEKTKGKIEAVEETPEEEEDEDEDGDEDDEDEPHFQKSKKAEPAAEANGDNAVIPEDEEDTPDILDINLADWDLAWPPIFHAITAGSLAALDELIVAGADVKIVSKFTAYNQQIAIHPLTSTILTEGDEKASKIIERLVKAGASSSPADEWLMSIFYRFVASGRIPLVSTILQVDPNAKAALNFPAVISNTATYPLDSAINSGSHAISALLLAYGAKLNYKEEDLARAREVT